MSKADAPKHKYLTFLNERVLEAGTARGLMQRDLKFLKYDTQNISEYYKAYLDDDKVRGMVDDLAEAATGNGYYNKVEELTPVLQKSATKQLCDDFGEAFRFDDFLSNVLRNMCIAGFCPVETILQKGASWDDFSKIKLTIIRPDTILPKGGLTVDPETHEIVKIIQLVDGKQNTITAEGNTRIVNFNYCQLGNDVRGVSFVRGMLNLLTTLNEATSAVNEILKRYLSPIGIWRGRKSVEALQKMVNSREAGQDIFLGNLSQAEMQDKIVEFQQIDPRVPFWTYLEYLDRRIWSYSRANDLWYVKDSTEASATVLDTIVGRHVTSFQRSLKRGVENYWYQPLIDMWYEGKECPRLEFGVEKTGVQDIQPGDFLSKGLELGYISQVQYFDVLRQLGVKIAVPLEPEQPQDQTVNPDETTQPNIGTGKTVVTQKEALQEALPRHETGTDKEFEFSGDLDLEKKRFTAKGKILDTQHYFSHAPMKIEKTENGESE